jgi:two-component system sensor histidine kinase KdpD
VHEAFVAESVVLLLPDGGALRPVASRGSPLSEEEVMRMTPSAGRLSSLAGWRRSRGSGEWGRTLVLAAAGRPVGLLALTGLRPPRPSRELLATFANHVALAVERAQLREQAVRMGVLEEVDRLRRALIGTVSHDLRTPLATIKASSSAMLDPDVPLDGAQTHELLELIEAQTDRLTRLVSNLLDMSRIQSGTLVPDAIPVDLRDLVVEAVETLDPSAAGRVEVSIGDDVSRVEVDHVFITEALVNLLDNALRHAPEGTPVVVDAVGDGGRIRVRVTDRGPGIPAGERDAVFAQAARRAGGDAERPSGGTGVGLTIVKSFVEAHGGHLEVEDADGGGARFCFDVPAAPTELSA